MAIRLNDTYLKGFLSDDEYKGIQPAVTAAHKTLTEKAGLGMIFSAG